MRPARRPRAPIVALITLFLVFGALLLAARVGAHDPQCAQTGAYPYQPYLNELATALTQAASNGLGSGYPALPQIEKGYPQSSLVDASIPPVLLKAIAYTESSWHQAHYTVTRGSYGPPLMTQHGPSTESCGYGVMQITSGMKDGEPGALPDDTQYNIANDYRYNVGWGAKMLVEKWNYTPEYRPAVGSRNPCVGEDWYYAVWSYNGWLWRNNPSNPDYPWPRPTYDWRQGHSRSNYPYQEIVWGFAAYPATDNGSSSGNPLWAAVALTIPTPDEIGPTPADVVIGLSPYSRDACYPYKLFLPLIRQGNGGW